MEEKFIKIQEQMEHAKACYLWAEFFESKNIAWVYCPASRRDSELDRESDFYLPDQNAYFIVDLVKPGRKRIDCKRLSKHFNRLIVLGGAKGEFRIFEDGEAYAASESWLCQCAACERYFFLNSIGFYACKVCGEYDGDHHLRQIITGAEAWCSRPV